MDERPSGLTTGEGELVPWALSFPGLSMKWLLCVNHRAQLKVRTQREAKWSKGDTNKPITLLCVCGSITKSNITDKSRLFISQLLYFQHTSYQMKNIAILNLCCCLTPLYVRKLKHLYTEPKHVAVATPEGTSSLSMTSLLPTAFIKWMRQNCIPVCPCVPFTVYYSKCDENEGFLKLLVKHRSKWNTAGCCECLLPSAHTPCSWQICKEKEHQLLLELRS